ncbi:T9SS type A sorting domain-containing protein [Flammeovirga pectinis]|uniref:T9SS type A sorting domain-containing protein n=1 Tax=Flammeovirga pectinis TaxID=2494373 RepID=A0A3Q9FSE9_9BACT|nr:T9SS type A sorting domain-containing protein [Flammeovirga pectinis]AZQ64857.1 T9SS type A sorting domain-containing protein [Flammeovirga pectinis]
MSKILLYLLIGISLNGFAQQKKITKNGSFVWLNKKIKIPENTRYIVTGSIHANGRTRIILGKNSTFYIKGSHTLKASNFKGNVCNAKTGKPNVKINNKHPKFLLKHCSGKNLPVELSDFEIQLHNENKIGLNWVTQMELNNSHFIIERSKDGKHYELVQDSIIGAGNSNTAIEYTFHDENPLKGKSFYRLTQVDFDNTKEIWVQSVYNGEEVIEESVNIYPNPAQYEMNVLLNTHENETPTFQLISTSTGQTVQSIPYKNDNPKYTFNISTIKAGNYVLVISVNGVVKHKEKVIIIGNKSRGNKKEKD